MNDINYIEAIKKARAAGNKTLARDLTTQGVLLGLDGVMTTMNETMDIASPADTSMYDAKLNDMGLWRGRNYYDTDSVIQGYINQPKSFSVDADDLNPSGWQSAGKIATMAGQGALTGLQIGGMPGAIIGGAVSGLAGFFGDRYARNANKLNADILNSKADTEVDLNKIALRAAADQAHDYQFGQAWSQRKADGGDIHIKKENEGKFTAAAKRRNMTVQEFAKHVLSEQNKDKYSATMRRRANFARNAAKWHDDGGQLDNSNMSSDFNTHGGFYSPGLMHIGAGGTHEQNPNGGVQLGVDVQGTPNLVEEGESVYKDYVFSDRLKPTAKELKDNNIPEKYAGKSFSEISKILGEEAEQRPNDAVSARGMGAMLDRLSICQEVHKQKKEAAELRRELASMSDEELAALGQALAASSVPEQVPVAQQGAPAMMPYPQAEGYADPQFAAVPEEQAVMKCGGRLANKYVYGTPDKKKGEPEKEVGPLATGYVYSNPDAYTGSFWKPAENNGEAAGYKEAMLPDSYTGYGTAKIPAPGTGMADTTVREDAPVAPPKPKPKGSVAQAAAAVSQVMPDLNALMPTDAEIDAAVNAGMDPYMLNMAELRRDVDKDLTALKVNPLSTRDRIPGLKPDRQVLPTGLRYAGAASNLLTGLYNMFQQPDKVDWGYVQPQYVNGRMALQRAQYDPLDVQAAINQVVAQNNATARQVANSGLGPSTGAALLAANANAGRNMGSALSAATLANAQQRNAVLAQNNAAEQAESEFYRGLNATNADIYNRTAQYNKQLAMDQALRNIQFENEKYAAVSNALNAAATDLANIGRENFVFNQANTNDALFYGTGIDGSSYYKASDGSYFKVDRMTGNKIPVTVDEALQTRTKCNGGLLKKFNG